MLKLSTFIGHLVSFAHLSFELLHVLILKNFFILDISPLSHDTKSIFENS